MSNVTNLKTARSQLRLPKLEAEILTIRQTRRGLLHQLGEHLLAIKDEREWEADCDQFVDYLEGFHERLREQGEWFSVKRMQLYLYGAEFGRSLQDGTCPKKYRKAFNDSTSVDAQAEVGKQVEALVRKHNKQPNVKPIDNATGLKMLFDQGHYDVDKPLSDKGVRKSREHRSREQKPKAFVRQFNSAVCRVLDMLDEQPWGSPALKAASTDPDARHNAKVLIDTLTRLRKGGA